MKRVPKLPLGEVCEINPRLPKSHGLHDDSEVGFVPMAALDEVTGTIAQRLTRRFAEVRKGYTPFAEGDVLFAKITPCMENGKVAIARDLPGGCGFGSTEFHVLRVREAVLPEWVYYFMRRRRFRDMAKHSFVGTAGRACRPPTSPPPPSRCPRWTTSAAWSRRSAAPRACCGCGAGHAR